MRGGKRRNCTLPCLTRDDLAAVKAMREEKLPWKVIMALYEVGRTTLVEVLAGRRNFK